MGGGELKKDIVRNVNATISLGTAIALTIGALPVTAMAESAENLYIDEPLAVVESRKEADYTYEGFNYNILEDDTIEIVGYSGKASSTGEFTIPSEIDGKSVKSIADNAFDHCIAFTNLIISDGITEIGESAFYCCINLKSISIPDSVSYIGARAFDYCTNLAAVTIPKGVTVINEYTFNDCFKMKNVILHDGITKINEGAFSSCGFTGITLPSKITAIDAYSFYCTKLTDVAIPEGVECIGESAFSNCHELESVAIPETVEYINKNAFVFCEELDCVYYGGSEVSWDKITVGDNNGSLLSATFVYAKGETYAGNFVERLYVNMLARPSDAGGKAKWVEKLNNGATAADVAVNFVLSEELKQQKLSNETFVKRMYQTMLDRIPKDSEIANWASYLDAGCTYAFVFRGFLTAPEFSKLCANYGVEAGTYATTENRDVNGKLTKFISRLYTKALNRSYDVSGLNHHTGNYISGKYTLDKIAYGFIFSPEFEKRNLSNSDFVECMYNTFFDRASDANGKASWPKKMANGMTREQVFNGFVTSPEYKALVKSFGL